jgi:hypothetical protein
MSPVKKKSPAAKRSQAEQDELAEVLAEVLAHTCNLVNEVLTVVEPSVSLAKLYPIVERMEHYLNRRGRSSSEASWVALMRTTVTRYKIRAKLSKAPGAIDLH